MNKFKNTITSLAILTQLGMTECSTLKTIPKQVDQAVGNYLPASLLADKFGNNNGLSEKKEEKKLEKFFKRNREAYILSGPGLSLLDKIHYQNTVSSETALEEFMFWGVAEGPFESEEKLREAFKGVGIKTPNLTVYKVVPSEKGYSIANVYIAPGGYDLADGEWEKLEIE